MHCVRLQTYFAIALFWHITPFGLGKSALPSAELVESPDGRIIGGTPLKPNSMPWLILIEVLDIGRFVPWCGGVLVADTIVLTLARCVNDIRVTQLKVLAGEHTLEFSEQQQPREVKNITFLQSSVEECPTVYALLEVKTKFNLNYAVKLAKWAQPIHSVKGPVRIAGWGARKGGGDASNYPYEIIVPVIERKECESLRGQNIPEDVFCASEPGKGICTRDPGNPVMEGDLVVGLADSFLDHCNTTIPNYHTRMDLFAYELEKFLCKNTGTNCRNYQCNDATKVKFGISSRVVEEMCLQRDKWINQHIHPQRGIKGYKNVTAECMHYTWMIGDGLKAKSEYGCFQEDCP